MAFVLFSAVLLSFLLVFDKNKYKMRLKIDLLAILSISYHILVNIRQGDQFLVFLAKKNVMRTINNFSPNLIQYETKSQSYVVFIFRLRFKDIMTSMFTHKISSENLYGHVLIVIKLYQLTLINNIMNDKIVFGHIL